MSGFAEILDNGGVTHRKDNYDCVIFDDKAIIYYDMGGGTATIEHDREYYYTFVNEAIEDLSHRLKNLDTEDQEELDALEILFHTRGRGRSYIISRFIDTTGLIRTSEREISDQVASHVEQYVSPFLKMRGFGIDTRVKGELQRKSHLY